MAGPAVNVPTAGHVDNHSLRFAPASSTTILAGNDGGLFRTTNGGTNWTSLNSGLAITQFYQLGLSKITPTLMVAGAQDNGNMKLAGGTWTNTTNADGMGGFIDFSNDNNVYATIQYGALFRSTNGGSTWTPINTPSSGAWVTPFLQSRTVANTIYAGTDKVYKSTNQGTTWTAISTALSGVAQLTILKVHTNPNFLLAGDGDKLFRTTNGGTAWTDITGTLPVGANYLTDAVMNDNNPQMIWVTFSGYNAGQKVYKSSDGGTTWTNIWAHRTSRSTASSTRTRPGIRSTSARMRALCSPGKLPSSSVQGPGCRTSSSTSWNPLRHEKIPAATRPGVMATTSNADACRTLANGGRASAFARGYGGPP
jgi:photosystem II stability/assembly factor-like uncharacterized protein